MKGTPSSALEHTTQRKQPGWYEFPRACRIWGAERQSGRRTPPLFPPKQGAPADRCSLSRFWCGDLCGADMVKITPFLASGRWDLAVFTTKIRQTFHQDLLWELEAVAEFRYPLGGGILGNVAFPFNSGVAPSHGPRTPSSPAPGSGGHTRCTSPPPPGIPKTAMKREGLASAGGGAMARPPSPRRPLPCNPLYSTRSR